MLGGLLEVFAMLVAFVGLAIVCDDHLVVALETLCVRWNVREDVAGASFLAIGSAAPELVINAIGVMKARSVAVATASSDAALQLGLSAIIGSGMLAFLMAPAICTLGAGQVRAWGNDLNVNMSVLRQRKLRLAVWPTPILGASHARPTEQFARRWRGTAERGGAGLTPRRAGRRCWSSSGGRWRRTSSFTSSRSSRSASSSATRCPAPNWSGPVSFWCYFSTS
jgi:hypothetical protein